MKFFLLTGMSGAGKTAALRFLEDSGGFCVDNLPPAMMLQMITLCEQNKTGAFAAFSVDVRSGAFFDAKAVSDTIAEVRRLGHSAETVFLEAGDDVLLSRYKESRREHPLSGKNTSLPEAIAMERGLLSPLRETADWVIDTSQMKLRDLQKRLRTLALGGESAADALRVEVMSFGYKRGLPREADLVWDVRFLPNPFYIPELKKLTGLDAPVREYVLGSEVTQAFLRHAGDMLTFLLPHYREEGKHRLVIAVGCTGGAHRSVAIAEAIGAALRAQGWPVTLGHRDIALEQARWQTGGAEEE